jgi:hypothetical protein
MRLLPERIRKPLKAARMLWATGELAKPRELAEKWRHRAAFKRVHKALFYHRYATAFFLGHEAGVFNQLYAAPRSVDELADACSISPRAADSLLRVLESERLVTRDGDRYRLTDFGKLYMAREGRYTMAPTLDLMAAQAAAFPEVRVGMQTGRVPSTLDIFSEDGRYNSFLDAVNSFLYFAGAELLQEIDLPDIRTFILGSMGVSFSALLLARYPQSLATYGCLDHLVRQIPRLRDEYRVPAHRVAGMHAHSGDPEADRWGDESYDLVFLTKKMILEPETRMGQRFAAKAYEVLNPGGVAIFWETLHTDDRPTPLPRAMEAVLDLGASPVGLVNTESGMRTLLERIGYRRVEIVPVLEGSTTFVVARKQ